MKIGDFRVVLCPHCGNRTPHKLVFEHTYTTVWYGSDGKPSEGPDPASVYLIFECSTCHDISLYDYVEFENEEDAALRYPKGDTLDKSVPTSVANNYREAKRVQQVSPNAFAVLIRRALEAMCDHRGIPTGRLQQRLEELARRGEIPPVLAEITSVLRTLGNSGAHNTNQNVTVPMTWKMDEFFTALIEYVYVAPSRLKEFTKKVSKGKEDIDG
jgi:hypothetical protein